MAQGERVGTTLDNKYELTSLLGEGGMGAVYEAQHKLINRRLAVKFLHPQYADNEEVVTRFQREAQAAARIGHENIIEITDMGTAPDGAPYIVMEYLQGVDVKGLIEEQGILPVGRAANIMVQALAALQAAHNAGIIHRDLKPENVFLISKSANSDYVKLLDFGISKFKELETDGQKALTQTGTVLGTPHYMSPEQARGEQNLTPRSDIYAMGVILYQMLTGELPFDAPNYNALLIKILTEDPPLPETLNPDLPEDVANIIKIAMARDLNERFESCDEFGGRLVSYATNLGDQTGAISVGSGMHQTMRRAPSTSTLLTPMEMAQSGISPSKGKLSLMIGAAAAALVAVGVSLALFLGNDDQREVPTVPAVPVAANPLGDTGEATDTGEAVVSEDTADAPDEVRVSIQVTPENAKIQIDGVPVSNPYSAVKRQSDVDVPLVIEAPGYEKHSQMVSFSDDIEMALELEKETTKTNRSGTRRASTRPTVTTPKKAEKRVVVTEKPATAKDPTPEKKKSPRRKIDYDDPWK